MDELTDAARATGSQFATADTVAEAGEARTLLIQSAVLNLTAQAVTQQSRGPQP
jgi:hypothetical protein